MKKILQMSLALLISMPVCSQLVSKPARTMPLNERSGLLMNSGRDASATRTLPKESKRIDYRTNSTNTYIVTYDLSGHEVSVINPTGLTNEIHEYDETGRILLNKYKETRKSTSDTWVKPDRYAIRTTLNAEGIRTAIEHENYTSIKLNNEGLVTYSKTKSSDKGTIIESTMTWDGNRLTGLTSRDIMKTSEQKIVLNNIELHYTSSEFNPYEIDYYNLIAYGIYETNPVFIGINATGTITGTSSGQTMSADMTFTSRTLEKQEGMYEAPKTMKGYTKGALFLSMDICDYKFTKTDANGSFIFEDHYSDLDSGTPYVYTYTVNYDQYGHVTKEQGVLVEKDKVKTGENYRFAWTYDSENKPVKVETYYSVSPEYKEQLIETEEFTAWFDPTGIHSTKLSESVVLGATLYTLSGTPVRKLTAGEVDSNIEVPSKGMYLLRIDTDKGIIVKKIMK